ncbi:MAG: hypothetical protein ABIN01_01680 [Ferruginibacter sp.]
MNNLTRKIIQAGFLVGTLDILAAFIYFFVKSGDKNVSKILKYIASGLFGKEAFSGGSMMIAAGLLLHYIIAFAFTIFFFLVFPKASIFSKNKILTGIVYGIFIWMVMNLVVVPSSKIPNRPIEFSNAILSLVILVVCIGIPLSFMATRFYRNKHEAFN